MEETVRLDKYLWAIRVYKSRGEATEACAGNKVKVNGVSAKPSRQIKPGDMLEVRKLSSTFTYKVLRPCVSRVGAQLVPEYAENLTPESELEKLRAPVETIVLRRDKGAGRPTKKDRRQLEQLLDGLDF